MVNFERKIIKIISSEEKRGQFEIIPNQKHCIKF